MKHDSLNIDRRNLLRGSAAVALATAVSGTNALAQQTPVLRRSVGTLPLNDPALNSYRKAVAAMKAAAGVGSAQLEQAGGHPPQFLSAPQLVFPALASRLSGGVRALCRQLSGDPKFALPYWDWTANPQLPAAFATPTFNGQPNPLFDATRNSQTVSIPASVAGPARITQILNETSYEVFGSSMPNGQNIRRRQHGSAPAASKARSKADRTIRPMCASAATWGK